jgi:hypothetical protein
LAVITEDNLNLETKGEDTSISLNEVSGIEAQSNDAMYVSLLLGSVFDAIEMSEGTWKAEPKLISWAINKEKKHINKHRTIISLYKQYSLIRV